MKNDWIKTDVERMYWRKVMQMPHPFERQEKPQPRRRRKVEVTVKIVVEELI